MIVTGSQIRAAHALRGWTQARLAKASGLHLNAVAYWEHHDEIPTGVWREPVACRRIRKALLDGGVEFLQLPLVGVRLVARHNNAPNTRRRAGASWGLTTFATPEMQNLCNTRAGRQCSQSGNSLRGQDTDRQGLRTQGHGQRPLPQSRRAVERS